jgi:hypothetical protein
MTNDQREARDLFAQQVGPSYRIDSDAEGWPIIPGRYGQIEWYDGQRLAVFTVGRLIRGRLLAIPETRRTQTGDFELRATFPPQALLTVANVILARRKRRPSRAQLENLRPFTKHAADS